MKLISGPTGTPLFLINLKEKIMYVKMCASKMLIATFLIASGLCGTAMCQYAAEFDSYHGGNRYEFRLTTDELAKTPAWNTDDPNPPLSVGQAKLVGSEYLKHLFADAEKWTLKEIMLHPIGNRWVYTISFTESMPSDCRNCMIFPFNVVVRMDGVAVAPCVSPWDKEVPGSTIATGPGLGVPNDDCEQQAQAKKK